MERHNIHKLTMENGIPVIYEKKVKIWDITEGDNISKEKIKLNNIKAEIYFKDKFITYLYYIGRMFIHDQSGKNYSFGDQVIVFNDNIYFADISLLKKYGFDLKYKNSKDEFADDLMELFHKEFKNL